MANLVPFTKLEVGKKYFEEWKYGLHLCRMTVTEKLNDACFKCEYELHDGLSFSYWPQLIKERDGYRYWDSQPSSTDFENNPWPINTAVCP